MLDTNQVRTAQSKSGRACDISSGYPLIHSLRDTTSFIQLSRCIKRLFSRGYPDGLPL